MTLDDFIKTNNIKPADSIVVRKKFISLVDHYLIYLGNQFGEHKFIANYTQGTKILSYSELNEFASEFGVSRIRRFLGNDTQRKTAVSRALSRKDQNSYHLLYNNCEHFANYVQNEVDYSKQTRTLGAGLTTAGIITALASKSDTTKALGILAAALGLITLVVEEEKK